MPHNTIQVGYQVTGAGWLGAAVLAGLVGVAVLAVYWQGSASSRVVPGVVGTRTTASASIVVMHCRGNVMESQRRDSTLLLDGWSMIVGCWPDGCVLQSRNLDGGGPPYLVRWLDPSAIATLTTSALKAIEVVPRDRRLLELRDAESVELQVQDHSRLRVLRASVEQLGRHLASVGSATPEHLAQAGEMEVANDVLGRPFVEAWLTVLKSLRPLTSASAIVSETSRDVLLDRTLHYTQK